MILLYLDCQARPIADSLARDSSLYSSRAVQNEP